MGTNRNILRPGQKERLRKGAIQGSCYYNHFLKDKTFIVVTEDYMYCSITFKKQDFCHFTGLSIARVSESNFFDICLNGTITNSNIRDEQHYDYNTLRVKNNILKKLNMFCMRMCQQIYLFLVWLQIHLLFLVLFEMIRKI